ncbi:MAG: hypothetical protein R2764_22435 [Bacteroidales bacterium]
MKTKLYFLILLAALILLSTLIFAQGIAINQDESAPDPSAMLDVQSNDKGILIPRLTSGERTAVTTPANSLLVYDTDTKSFWFYDASISSWREVGSGGSGNAGSTISDADGNTYITVEENPNDDTARIFIAGQEKLRVSMKNIEMLNTGMSVFIGERAGANDDLTDNKNIFIGALAGESSTTGYANVALGAGALSKNTEISHLVAIGDSALYNNGVGALSYEGHFNTAVGSKTLLLIPLEVTIQLSERGQCNIIFLEIVIQLLVTEALWIIRQVMQIQLLGEEH